MTVRTESVPHCRLPFVRAAAIQLKFVLCAEYGDDIMIPSDD